MGLFKSIGKFFGKALKVMTFGASSYLWKKFKEWMTPDMPDKEALKVQRQGSNHPIPVVYGERILGAIIVDKNTQDIPDGIDNDLLHMFAVFCHGEIEGFVEFFFNGVSWNDKRWRQDPENPSSPKWFTYEVRLGTTAQTAMNGFGKFNRFSVATSKYEGLACAIFTFRQNADGNVWNGEPEITARIKGKKCFDPRSTLTVYTENPALHLLDYLKSPIYGKGLPDSLIDINSFINVANIADTTQTATVDTQICQTVEGVYSCTGSPSETVTFKRFTHNNIIDTDAEIFDNVKEIANSFRGYFPESAGIVQIACEKEENPVFSFSEANIVEEISSSVPGRNSRHNRVTVRFPNKANNFKMDEVSYPEPDSGLYSVWLAEDYNLPQEKVVTIETIVHKAEAIQLARLMAVISRNSEFVSFTADSTAIECDVGDVVTVSNSTRGWVNRTFRIAKMTFNDDETIQIEAMQHDNAIYPWVSPTYTNVIGGSNLGDPASVPAPTGLSIAYDTTLATTGTLTWVATPNAFTSGFVVTVLSGVTEIYKTETISKAYTIPRLDVGNYSIQVKAKTTIGTFSPISTIAFTLAIPVAPTDIAFTSGNFDIEARPVLAGIGLGTTFEYATDAPWTIRGRGLSLVITSLTPATTYTIYARTVNAYGVSAWFSKNASTNYDQSKLDPFLTAITNELNRINTVELVAVSQDVAALEAKFPLTGASIGSGVVTTIHIANDAITNAQIANLAINSAKIADNAVSTSKIVAGAVDAGKIAANAVGTTQLANLAITTAKIAANAVTTTEIANAAINTAKLANAAVNAAQLADGAVLAAKLADNAVTTTKIAAAAIDAGKIASNAVGSTHLADLAVNASKLAANAVTVGAIADGAVVASKINAQIGGGNLVRNSRFLSTWLWGPYNNNGNPSWRYDPAGRTPASYAFVTTAGNPAGSTLGVYGAVVKGGWKTEQTYVVSFYAKNGPSSSGTGAWLFWNDAPQYVLNLLHPTLNQEWQRYAFRVRWNAGASTPISLGNGVLWISCTGPGSEMWVSDVQVEEGELLTAFAPCVDEILPSSIGSTEIADNAITSPKIIAGAITAGKIAAGSITSTEIQAGSITADRIAAGSITSNQIQANSISATSLKIQPASFCPDPYFYDMEFWSKNLNDANGWFVYTSPTLLPAYNFTRCIALSESSVGTARKHLWSGRVQAPTKLDQVRLKATVINNSNQQINVAARFKRADGTDLGDVTISVPPYDNSLAPRVVTNSLAWLAGATAESVEFIVFNEAGSTFTANAFVTGVVLDIMTGSDLIVDGAIVANKIAAGAITADKIAANSITSSQIAAYTITTYNLAGNSVTANNLAANSVLSDKIAAGAITAGKIAAGAITANEIAAGTITSSKLVVTGGGAAINQDPACEDLTAWNLTSPNIYQASGAGGQGVGKYYFSCNEGIDSIAYDVRRYACDPAKTYKLSAMFYAQVGNSRHMYLFVNFYDLNGNNITGTTWGGSMSGYTFGGLPLEGDWRRVGAQFGPSTVREIPANAKTMSIGVWFQYSGSGSGFFQQAAQDIRLEECASADLIVDGAIVASKIQAGAVVAGKIAAGAVTAGTIAAGAVTADKISAYTLQAYHIATNSLTADQIAFRSIIGWNVAAETISTVNIAADAITAVKIAAGAITAGKIAAGSITSTEIAAGSITANNIAAGAITASKVLITGGGVINRDPMLQDADAWAGSGGFAIMTTSVAPVGTQVIATTIPSTVFLNEKFYHAIDYTKRYRVRFWARRDANANGILYFSLRQFLDNNGTHGPINGGRSPYKPSGISPSTTWQEYSYEWNINDWQAGVKYVQMEWLLNYAGSAGYMEICNPRFEEMTSSDLIVDGAIIADKLASNSVVADKIAAGAIIAGKIGANSISGDEIQANAITAAKIAALNITGDKIAANAITADKIAANSIVASHINAGVITADKLTANAVQVALVEAGGLNVTNNNYQLKFLTADTPIELRKNGVIVYSVNPDGTGFYKGGLGDNTVGTNAITVEARKAINPFYTGIGELVTASTPSWVPSSSALTLGALTTLQAGNKVSISFRAADSFEQYGQSTNYTSSNYTATVQRSISGGGWVDVPNGQKAFTVTGYFRAGTQYPEPELSQGGYYYDVSFSVTDTVPTTSASVQYRVLITVTSAGVNTSGGVIAQQLKAEKAGFTSNTFSNTGSVMKWVDKETGFTVICGTVTVNGDSSVTVSYGHTLSAVASATAQRAFTNYSDWAAGAINAGTTSATIYNQNITGLMNWTVMGFTAI